MPLIALKSIGLLLSGTVLGFFSSSPLGPINLLVADSVMGQRQLHRNAFIAGVIIAELALAAIAFWGYHRFFQGPLFSRWAPIVGGVFVMGLGIVGFITSFSNKTKNANDIAKGGYSGRKSGGDFLQGFFLCGSNPAFLLFWIYVMSTLSHSDLTTGVPLKTCFLLLGIALGNTLWFAFYLRLLHRGADRLQGKLRWIRMTISMALILLGFSGVIIFF
ncbi:MAG: LysE family translocator [Flavobacteriales bacterium]